jgi:hypothetical protein
MPHHLTNYGLLLQLLRKITVKAIILTARGGATLWLGGAQAPPSRRPPPKKKKKNLKKKRKNIIFTLIL